MADSLDPERRSANMAKIRSRDTGPEIAVRRAAHAAGLRFRLHRRDLPGTPDLVFPKARLAVFVHGCFWHRHAGCSNCTMPKTRTDFWQAKFERNVSRDREARDRLSVLGWMSMIIWECETRRPATLAVPIEALRTTVMRSCGGRPASPADD